MVIMNNPSIRECDIVFSDYPDVVLKAVSVEYSEKEPIILKVDKDYSIGNIEFIVDIDPDSIKNLFRELEKHLEKISEEPCLSVDLTYECLIPEVLVGQFMEKMWIKCHQENSEMHPQWHKEQNFFRSIKPHKNKSIFSRRIIFSQNIGCKNFKKGGR